MTDNPIGDGTAAGLAEYLDVLVDKGRATDGAIRPLKTAFVKVIKKVDGDNWQATKVDSIDVADYISRFSVLTRGTYNPRTIAVYRARLQRVVGWYIRFMSTNEAGWMPQIDTRTQHASTRSSNLGPTEADESVSDEVDGLAPVPLASSTASSSASVPTRSFDVSGLIDYPFPVANGQIAVLRLPAALTTSDAERLSRFVSSLVIDAA